MPPPTALLAGRDGRPRARRGQLTFCSWGGALSDLEKAALLEPFAASRGLSFNYASPTNYAKLRAMVEAGAPEWDLVDTGGRFIFEGAEYLEPLDMSLIPNAAALDPGWVTPRGIFTSTGATIMAWNTKAIPGPGPQSWKDFWDVKTFPGARGLYKPFYYNYEIALMAAGLSHRGNLPGDRRKGAAGDRQAEGAEAEHHGLVDRRRTAGAAVYPAASWRWRRPGPAGSRP